jgi:hypothetical protein
MLIDIILINLKR